MRYTYKIGASKISSVDEVLYEYHCPLVKE
jgi:hypothetical protein